MQTIMNKSDVTDNRKELRNHSTPAEAILWRMLKGKQIAGLKFRCQHSVGPYVLDFYCPQIKLAIELDGEVHNRQQDYDEQRSYFLNRVDDIEVLRFENRTVACESGTDNMGDRGEVFFLPPPPFGVLLLPGGGEWR